MFEEERGKAIKEIKGNYGFKSRKGRRNML